LHELAQRAPREKVINALRKSWGKMTPQAQELAITLPFAGEEKSLLHAALEQHQVPS
jgi:hypothetical protein